MLYIAEYENDEMRVYECDTDREAIQEALDESETLGLCFGVWELNDNYDKIRNVM